MHKNHTRVFYAINKLGVLNEFVGGKIYHVSCFTVLFSPLVIMYNLKRLVIIATLEYDR